MNHDDIPDIPNRRATFDGAPMRPRTKVRYNWNAIAATIITMIVGIAIGLGAGLSLHQHADDREGLIPPCATEDSVGCYWDADSRGNHTGTDIVVLPCTDAIANAGGICYGEPR